MNVLRTYTGPLLFAFIILLIVCAILFSKSLIARKEMDNIWQSQIERSVAAIRDTWIKEDYAWAMTALRQLKWFAESGGRDKEEYIRVLETLHSNIPKNISDECLPYDLRNLEDEQILFGLVQKGAGRLTGQDRRTEMARVASEIAFVSGAKNFGAIKIYKEIVDRWRTMGLLAEADIKVIDKELSTQDNK